MYYYQEFPFKVKYLHHLIVEEGISITRLGSIQKNYEDWLLENVGPESRDTFGWIVDYIHLTRPDGTVTPERGYIGFKNERDLLAFMLRFNISSKWIKKD